MGNRAEFGGIVAFDAYGELKAVQAFVKDALDLVGEEEFMQDDGDDLDEPGTIEDPFNVYVNYVDGYCDTDVREELTALGEQHGLKRLEVLVDWHFSDSYIEEEELISEQSAKKAVAS